MSDEVNTEVEAPEEQQPQTEPTVDEKIAAAIAAQTESFKAEINGLNRRNTELEKELENEKIAHMSEKEREKHEAEQLRIENEQLKAHAQEIQRKALITNGLASDGLDPSVMSLMREPKDESELEGWKAQLNKLIEPEVQKRVNERLAGTPKPKGGETNEPVNYAGKSGAEMSQAEFNAYLAATLQE